VPRGVYVRKAKPRTQRTQNAIEKQVWKHIWTEPMTGCWLWVGAIRGSGYGALRVDSRNYDAHRFVWRFYRGEISPEFELDHLCRVLSCVNPAHLEPVTHGENVRRGWPYRRQRLADPRPAENVASPLLVSTRVGTDVPSLPGASLTDRDDCGTLSGTLVFATAIARGFGIRGGRA